MSVLPSQRLSGRRGFWSNRRGVAMLMVVVAIAILTAVATEFAYNTRISLQMSVNQRDEIRAYYLARSGLALGRLLLQFQKQLDSVPVNLGGGIPGLGGFGSGAQGSQSLPGLPQQAGSSSIIPGAGLSIQLWKIAKVDCHMLQGMVSQPESSRRLSKRSAADRDSAGKPERRSFGAFDGCFDVKFTPEETKLNLNKLDSPQLASRPLVTRLVEIFNDKRFEFLFDREDANRVKISPNDLIIAMKDWIDEDEVQSTLNLTPQGEPFLKGFSDENYFYDRYTPRYKAKNAFFDTLDELYMVHGVNDRIMAAFRDRFTVYPDVNALPNINTDDPLLLYMAIMSVMDPLKPDPRMSDPVFVDELIKRIRAANMFQIFAMSLQDFVGILQSLGVQVNPQIMSNPQNNRVIGDKNQTYTLKSVGEAGSVEKTVTAVVRMDDMGLGRLLYWREE